MPHVYSTITNDTMYGHTLPGGADLRIRGRQILIKGGANRGGKGLITPYGVRTEVSEEELEYLRTVEAFNRHESKGFLKIVESRKAPEVEEVAGDMEKKDLSAPKTPVDYDKDKAPLVGEAKPAKKGFAKAAR